MKEKIGEAKVMALVVRNAAPDDVEPFGMVAVTELLEDGTWVVGMNLITSPEAVFEDAQKRNLDIVLESKMDELSNQPSPVKRQTQ